MGLAVAASPPPARALGQEGSRSLSGTVQVPGDKSISHRALLFGAIATGETRIDGLLPAEDPLSTAACLRAMGVTISPIAAGQPVIVQGVGLEGLREPDDVLDCGNSGTTMRLIMGLLAGRSGCHFVLNGDASLRQRPMGRVAEPLAAMGAQIRGRAGGKLAPLSIQGSALHGAVLGTPIASAQVKSAILLAGLTATGPTSVIEPARSRDHSERMLRGFGADIEIGGDSGRHVRLTPGRELVGQPVEVPGDISSAAFWLVAGAITPGADLTVRNVGLNPTRTGVLEVLEAMGARIERLEQRLVAGEPVGDLRVRYGPLQAFDIGGELIPRLVDEIPVLVVAACRAEGTSRIREAAELRVKETDRLAALQTELRKLGAQVDILPDVHLGRPDEALRITPPTRMDMTSRIDFDTYHDHRMAMALALVGLRRPNTWIRNPRCVEKTYPSYWHDFARLQT